MKFKTFYESIGGITTEQYYNELDNHLRQYGYRLGPNLFNPDIGYADPSYRGIYEGDDQIGHIDLWIDNGVLILEKIKSYAAYYGKDFGLLKKIYPFHKMQALKYSLIVKSELVSPKTVGYFDKIFSDEFDIKKVGNITTAIPKI
jgi:hypothetical protein